MDIEFRSFIQRLIKGAKDVLFRDVIKEASNHEIIEVNNDYLEIINKIRDSLKKSLPNISKSIEKKFKRRVNELSNYLEVVVQNHINHNLIGFQAYRPLVGTKKQSAGYPDLIVRSNKKFFYLEVKIYQKKTIDSSLRSFYFQPSKNNKISESCPHLLIGFEVESLGLENKSPFRIKDFKIIDLYELKVDLKPEFNANNPAIYFGCKEI